MMRYIKPFLLRVGVLAILILVSTLVNSFLFSIYTKLNAWFSTLPFSMFLFFDAIFVFFFNRKMFSSEIKGTMEGCFFRLELIMDLGIGIPLLIFSIIDVIVNGIGIPRA